MDSGLGIRVKFDGRDTAYVTLGAELKGDTRGLCGVYNGDSAGNCGLTPTSHFSHHDRQHIREPVPSTEGFGECPVGGLLG